jgi:hypothetical protein
MIKLGVKMINRIPSAADLIKQMNYGTAVGLTKTAQAGQDAVVSSLKSTFTLRGTWWQKNMRHGIKITPAKRDKLIAEVKTLADWLERHETGGIKTARGHRIAVPLRAMRAKGSTKILRGPQRPAALLASGKAFILDTPNGEVIARLKGKGQRLEILYGLEPSVRVKKESTFYEPIGTVVKRDLHANIRKGIIDAFKSMR